MLCEKRSFLLYVGLNICKALDEFAVHRICQDEKTHIAR